MAGILDIAQAIHQAITATVPTVSADVTFRGPRPGEATGMEPLTWIESPLRELREFQISAGFPVRDEGCQLTARLDVRIAYPLGIPDAAIIAASDVGRLATTVASSPSAWGSASSLTSLPVEFSTTLSDDRLPAVKLVTVPFQVWYRETP